MFTKSILQIIMILIKLLELTNVLGYRMKKHIKKKNDKKKTDMKTILRKDGTLLSIIPKSEQTEELCTIAIKQNPQAIKYASKKCLTKSLCLSAIKKDGKLFRYIPDRFLTDEMYLLGAAANPNVLEKMPEYLKNIDLYKDLLNKNISVMDYLLRHEKNLCPQLFDDSTDIEVIKQILEHYNYCFQFMPNRKDIFIFAAEYMRKYPYVISYFTESMKSSREVLSVQKELGIVSKLESGYFLEEQRFRIEYDVDWLKLKAKKKGIQISDSYSITVTFNTFDEFYKFSDGDIAGADLIDYDFVGINLHEYNIKGAVIRSSILKEYGLYDDSFSRKIKNVCKKGTEDEENYEVISTTDDFQYPKLNYRVWDSEYEHKFVIFYISDLHIEHRIRNRLGFDVTEPEAIAFAKSLARELIKSVGIRPRHSFLLIAGDTASSFELISAFYTELIKVWKYPNRIVVVSGNHELWSPIIDMDENIQIYRKFFQSLNIIYLQNELYLLRESLNQCGYPEWKSVVLKEQDILALTNEELQNMALSSVLSILGGIGFSGLNPVYNASKIRYGVSFETLSNEQARIKDIEEAERFNHLYNKVKAIMSRNRVIILTHNPKENWNKDSYNPSWIYINGHSHRNYFEPGIYADNQIGYYANTIGLKFFLINDDYDVFAKYEDGIHTITKEQYELFNRGKRVQISFNRDRGTIVMVKKLGFYLFFFRGYYSKCSKKQSVYLMSGGDLKKLPIFFAGFPYYYEHIDQYIKNIYLLLDKYTGKQKILADYIKKLGGSGRIHGCIIDVDMPGIEGYSFCHLFINIFDGTVTPYYALDITSRTIYKDFKTLIESRRECFRIAENYKQIGDSLSENLPDFKYSSDIAEWGTVDSLDDEGSYMYRISRIVRSLQHCINQGVIRIWNEDLLNNDFLNKILNANQIDDVLDERLVILDDTGM